MRTLTLSLVTVSFSALPFFWGAAFVDAGLALAQNDSTPSQSQPVPGEVPGSQPSGGQPGEPTPPPPGSPDEPEVTGPTPKPKQQPRKRKSQPKRNQSNKDL